MTTVTGQTDGDYDVIEVGAGEKFTKQLEEGEVWENKLIDITASGAEYQIHTQGNNCTIRNIGIRGEWDGALNQEPFLAYTTDPNGSVLVENIYLGDGHIATTYPDGSSGIFVPASHAGTLTVRNLYYADNPSNAVYGSSPGNPSEHPNPGAGGDVIIENSYSENHSSAAFRVGTDGSRVENCVSVGGNRGGWAYFNNPTYRNCDFSGANISDVYGGNGSWSVDGTATLENVYGDTASGNVDGELAGSARYTSPEDVDGVPTTPEEAAAGGGSDSSASSDTKSAQSSDDEDDQLPNVLLVNGSSDDVTRYEFEVGGEVVPSNEEGATIDDEDTIDGAAVQGSVADWKDAFRFSGDLEQLTVDGPGTVLVNDDEVDPADYGEDLPHALEIEGQGSPTSFEITVEGTIDLADGADPDGEATTISGSTVQSSVTDGSQTFRFSGALTDVTIIDGEATVSIDGDQIDPADYGDNELLPHALVIDGTDADEPSTYAFEASGAVVKATYRDASIDDEDVIEGKAVRGAVGNWLDAYWFDGDIEDFRLRGGAAIDVQYNVRDR
uniref:hypothetical protein n=1 Tax=Natronorubrum aibiense TaxID=348826 RepID=UPI0029CA4270|nr:hypothetical protein [Natronorubrum aibiense]